MTLYFYTKRLLDIKLSNYKFDRDYIVDTLRDEETEDLDIEGADGSLDTDGTMVLRLNREFVWRSLPKIEDRNLRLFFADVLEYYESHLGDFSDPDTIVLEWSY